ncbi:MAG TPA: DUF6599 family protein [Blastocatellia bacterium]
MSYIKRVLSFITIAVLFIALATAAVVEAETAGEQDSESMAVAPSRPMQELLAERIAGLAATGELEQYGPENIAELAGDRAPAFQEYSIASAASRQYGTMRVDVFETKDQFAAFGLFSYNAGVGNWQKVDVGIDGARAGGSLIFWKGRYFMRVNAGISSDRAPAAALRLARALAGRVAMQEDIPARPPLLDSLPAQSIVVESQRYLLGPESLNAFVERGGDVFGFAGDAEAVMAEYNMGDKLKLVIVEYHTPQFATDAFARATAQVESLGEADRDRIILKREGNYIVQALNVADRAAAQSLIDSIKYDYVVKWLKEPPGPGEDPLRAQKAAQMLLSTFGILGIMILAVLVGGAAFGTTIFLKRRKRQQQIFSDAGGMLRLELDPFEATIIGLPPKRSNQD